MGGLQMDLQMKTGMAQPMAMVLPQVVSPVPMVAELLVLRELLPQEVLLVTSASRFPGRRIHNNALLHLRQGIVM
jgi:hypothetical protein